VLRARGDNTEGRARLLREAQAIAKLQHPNVVVVYDVGTFGDGVFIAMEFVEGRTLSGWLHAAPRSRKDILRVFLAAGRGLAAAHAARLVHRDFKPDNVMVTNDGQVRVMDFGLARQATEAAEAPPTVDPTRASAVLAKVATEAFDPDATAELGAKGAATPASSSGSYLAAKLTLTGAMLGTPAYMAPEQFATSPTDERTDQFSFCVALYEFLYGQRPFEGDTFLTLMTAVATGSVRAPAANATVPGWMRGVLLRGLSVDPNGRFPSMDALLTALETDPTIRTKRLAATVGLVACLVVAAIAARRSASPQQNVCRGGADRWAGIWAPNGAPSARKTIIHDAFVATGKSYAAQAFTSASAMLDDYVGEWLALYTDTCEATHVRGEQSTEVLDLRMSCLNERLVSVRALVDVFERGGPDVVQNAVSAAGALPRLDRCRDVALLRAVVKPPEDEATRKQVEAFRDEKARLIALRDSGHCADALHEADVLLPKVRALGYPPLLAETLDASSFPSNTCIAPTLALERYEEAYTVALAAHDDELAARAATLAGNYATLADIGDYKAGQLWLAIARATLARIGGNPLLEAWTRATEACLAMHDQDWNRALGAHQQGRIEKAQVLGEDHPDVAVSDLNIAMVLQFAGHLDEAADADESARERLARVLGPEHPMVAWASLNEGDVLLLLHRYRDAHALLARALDIWTKAGSDAWVLAFPRTSIGTALLGEGHAAEAVEPLETALAAREAKQTDPEHLGETRFALARALWFRPTARERARRLATVARADYAKLKTAAEKVAEIDAWLRAPTAKL